MNRLSRYSLTYIFALFASCQIAKADSYWQCSVQDKNQKNWSAKNTYKRVALTMAMEFCKKESLSPVTCENTNPACIGFNQKEMHSTAWKCTAFDFTATSWVGDYYEHRDKAVLGAKNFCKHKSPLPDSCYVNNITCVSNKMGL